MNRKDIRDSLQVIINSMDDLDRLEKAVTKMKDEHEAVIVEQNETISSLRLLNKKLRKRIKELENPTQILIPQVEEVLRYKRGETGKVPGTL